MHELVAGDSFRVIPDALSLFGYVTKRHRGAIWKQPNTNLVLWFIQYSDYHMPQQSGLAGQNRITENFNVITDIRKDGLHYNEPDQAHRLVFAKLSRHAKSKYIFLGRYKFSQPSSSSQQTWIRTDSSHKIS